MPIQVKWDDESKTIIHVSVDGDWTWEEFYQSFDQGKTLLESVNHKVDFVVHMENAKTMPLGALNHGRKIMTMDHPNRGLTVYTGETGLMKALIQIGRRMEPEAVAKYDHTFAVTDDDARKIIGERRGNGH
jgi:hypothetical protein